MAGNTMTKHDILTEQEMSGFAMNQRVVRQIEHFREKMNLEKSQMNILDWGCGRGRAVAWLRADGYNAFGADVDAEPIENCRPLFTARGMDANALISLLEDGEERKFPDDFFHFTCSDGVFEHVRDIEQVAATFERLTVAGGVGVHFFPAHKHVVEIHLFMPFVHWLPENKLRKIYILLWLLLGKGPGWKELRGRSKWEQAHAYYEYSALKTYYRTPRQITEVFARHGFKVDFISLADFGLERHPLLARLAGFRVLRPLLDWGMRNVGQVGLLITKKKC
ncbi:MAG: methyltransferase domain-containing protein [Phycisphaerales bacterium]|nr:MAG: methyltransferase domain-containing protein [Phycisphaerales bacterium]